MKTSLGVAWREIGERWLLWPASLFVGVLALLIPLLPWVRTDEPALVRGVIALVGSVLLGVGTLLLVGSTSLCRDWTENRLSFYLARPIGAANLWSGKLLATLILTAGSIALVWLPPMLAGSAPWHAVPFLLKTPDWVGSTGLAVGLILTIGLGVFVSHALGVVVHLRSWLSLFDLAALVILGLAISHLLHRFSQHGDPLILVRPAGVILTVVATALGLAGWVQLRFAGTDSHRSHGVFSAWLWVPLGLTVIGLIASTARLDQPKLRHATELTGWWPISSEKAVVRATISPWHNRPFLLIDGDRHTVPLASWPRQQHPPIASADHRWLAWPSREAKLPYQLNLLDLTAPQRAPRNLGSLSIDGSMALRSGASSFAVGNAWIALLGVLEPSVFLVPAEGSIGSHRITLPFAWIGTSQLAFLDDGRLRLWLGAVAERPITRGAADIAGLIVLDIDPETRTITEVARLPDHNLRAISPRGDRVVVSQTGSGWSIWNGDATTHLLDLPRVGVHQSVPFEFDFDGGRSCFLANGGYTFLTSPDPRSRERSQTRLHALGTDGVPTWVLDLPGRAYLGAEIAPGRLLVGSGPKRIHGVRPTSWLEGQLQDPISAWKTLVIDVAAGEVVHTIDDLVPLPGQRPTGSAGSDWLLDARGWPVRLDPQTHTTVPIPGFDRKRP